MNKKICAAVIAVLIVFTVWQGVSAAKRFKRLSFERMIVSSDKELLDKLEDGFSIRDAAWLRIALLYTANDEYIDDMIGLPQRHDITEKEIKSVLPNTPVEEFVSRFGGIHGGAGDLFPQWFYFLEDGKYVVFETGTVESEDGTSHDVVTALRIVDSVMSAGYQVF